MPLAPLTDDDLRSAQSLLSRVARGDVQLASKIVGEVLLDSVHAGDEAQAARVDARRDAAGATDATAEIEGVQPIAVLRRGAVDTRERALLSVLVGMHLAATLDRDDGARALRDLVPALDELEFRGPLAPYAAARVVLEPAARLRFDAVVADAPIEASSSAALEAIRAIRAASRATSTKDAAAGTENAAATVAGEVEGMYRGPIARALGIVTGWSLVRGVVLGVLRWVFSYRRPITVSLDGSLLRVVGHSELMGRTLRTFDVRYPIAELVELRREARFPALPAALSATAVGLGALLGARAVVEGAGVAYFPLIAIGIGLVLGGLMFDLLLRALFPGIRGAVRVVVRAQGARAIVLTRLDAVEVDRLLDAIDRRFGAAPRRPAGSESRGASPSSRPGPVRSAREAGGLTTDSAARTASRS